MGYTVSVYDNNGREIDFIAEKDGKRYFVQAACSLAGEKAYQREFSAFGNICQTDSRIIITNDGIDYSTSAVKHIRLKDFLLVDDLGQ